MPAHSHNLRSRGKAADSPAAAPAADTAVSSALDEQVVADKGASQAQAVEDHDPHAEAEVEFGGAPGTFAMMTGFPALFYYLYVCLFFNDAKFAKPENPYTFSGPGGWADFLHHVVLLVVKTAAPTKRATAIYLIFLFGQLFLAFIMPGVQQKGLPLAHKGGKVLNYHCNAYTATYATMALVFAAHYYRLAGFDMAELIDLYGPLLTVASISGFTLAALTYVTGEHYRMSGNLIYDYFMGSSLNPRIGIVDIKMFCEIRVSWSILFALAMSAVAKQYQEYGYVSGNTALFAYGTWLYLNACCKGEQYIPQTWDMNFEKFGWLLSYWNLAGVPFSYCYPAIYMAKHDPATYAWSKPTIIALFVIITLAQVMMDISMAQKSHLKAMKTGTYIKRYTFPQLPWAELENPKTFKTKRGELLIDGFWAYLRKPNYISDWVQGLIWGLSAGTNSKIPFFYPVFHGIMLLHRNARDDAKCARKYGDDWVAYKKMVPYSYIYGLF
ncbi:hypothetical protein JCM10207_006157 [Rhodosporidiobolus poonsookiae]